MNMCSRGSSYGIQPMAAGATNALRMLTVHKTPSLVVDDELGWEENALANYKNYIIGWMLTEASLH